MRFLLAKSKMGNYEFIWIFGNSNVPGTAKLFDFHAGFLKTSLDWPIELIGILFVE